MIRHFLWLYRAACGILVPNQGLNPQSLHWKCGVLTPRLPGKSLINFLLSFFSFLFPSLPSFLPRTIEGLPRWLSGKESACQCRTHKRWGINPWVGKTPRRRKWQPTPVLLPGKSHGQRSLVGSSAWGRRESDRNKWLSAHTHTLKGYKEKRRVRCCSWSYSVCVQGKVLRQIHLLGQCKQKSQWHTQFSHEIGRNFKIRYSVLVRVWGTP